MNDRHASSDYGPSGTAEVLGQLKCVGGTPRAFDGRNSGRLATPIEHYARATREPTFFCTGT
jgi:hypothetical protein